jgi:uncharacterized DUF497 family protein
MEKLRFSWDGRKAVQNLKKHGVSFEDASTVFFDENAKEYFDPDHSADEDRFLMLGFDCRLRLLVVSYCFDRQGRRQLRKKANLPEVNYEKRIRFFKTESQAEPIREGPQETGNAAPRGRCD